MSKLFGNYPLTVGTLQVDNRLGGFPRYYISNGDDDCSMQIPEVIRECVAFACFRTTGGMKLAGTVFFVRVNSDEIGAAFIYVVTARHVIAGIQKESSDGKVLLRVNMKAGASQLVETDISQWKFHPDDVADVAVLQLALPQETVAYRTIPVEMAATEEVIKQEEIGVGDDVFLTGLFVNHVGRERNLPIVRVGNIALMPEERVQTKAVGPIDAYLVESRSIGGLSGSPVFVYLGSARRVGNTMNLGANNRYFWLGLMHGHFDLDRKDDEDLTQDAFAQERVNMGIAIVVPAYKILEVINQPEIVSMREKIIKEQQQRQLPTADSTSVSLTEESFEDALKKVSRKVKPIEPDPTSTGTSE